MFSVVNVSPIRWRHRVSWMTWTKEGKTKTTAGATSCRNTQFNLLKCRHLVFFGGICCVSGGLREALSPLSSFQGRNWNLEDFCHFLCVKYRNIWIDSNSRSLKSSPSSASYLCSWISLVLSIENLPSSCEFFSSYSGFSLSQRDVSLNRWKWRRSEASPAFTSHPAFTSRFIVRLKSSV